MQQRRILHQTKTDSWDSISRAPVLSVVIPSYGVEKYVRWLLESLDAQDCDPALVEIIFVIDGSPDRTEETILSWLGDTKLRVLVISQSNMGVSGALNTGLYAARGRWVTFAGPDDRLSRDYFSALLAAIAENPNVEMFVSRLNRVAEDGTRKDHPLDFKFDGVNENKLVRLDEDSEMIQLHAGMTVFSRERLERDNIIFDERLTQGFEDAHLVSRYLLTLNKPQYLLVPSADYYYVAREGSLTSLGGANYVKYISTAEYAYLDLLERAGNTCPEWLGNLLLYDLWWLFRQYLVMQSGVFSLPAEQQKKLHELTRKVLARIGLKTIRKFRIVGLPFDVRAAWENACAPGAESTIGLLREYDPIRNLRKIVFHSSHKTSNVRIVRGNYELVIQFQHVREILFFDEVWMYEHIYWVVPAPMHERNGPITITDASPHLSFLFDGEVVPGWKAGRRLKTISLQNSRYHQKKALSPINLIRNRLKEHSQRLSFALAFRFYEFTRFKKKFNDAWVLIDRDIQANDNAEALYRYLAESREDINAWFVVNKSSPDYHRLKKDGFKLVKHGTKRHFYLMKNAEVLASSMIDNYIVSPFPRKYLPKTWLYSFLQHGVANYRLHRWWNSKNVDHLVTSTWDEYASIVDSPSPYKLSEREVELSGMPRHDRLQTLIEEHQHEEERSRKTVLIMPTWRNYLFAEAKGTGARDQLDGFYSSAFVRHWTSVINGSLMRRLSADPGYEVMLLPHPGIDEHWDDLPLPSGMKRLSYLGADVQRALVRADLTVTDYSSQAFEGAYCGVPTVYFQFDRDEFFAGGHIGSPGYFNYERDGFGPVTETLEDFEQALVRMLEQSHPNYQEYLDRIRNLYAYQDGKASQRVTKAIEARLKRFE